MKLLLDTHILLWWLADLPELGKSIKKLLVNKTNMVFVSAASAWEIAIKRAIGKLDAPSDLAQAIEVSGFNRLPIAFQHAIHAGALPFHHSDPFDRMLIAQAELEELTVVTHDAHFARYDIRIIQT